MPEVPRQALRQADALSLRMPPGTAVRYWTGAREGEGRLGRLRHAFTVLPSGTVVGWVDTHAACIAARHIEAEPVFTREGGV